MSIDLRPGASALESPKAVPGAETVASHWLAVSSALTQTQAVQNASIPPEAWTGAAADAASNEIQVLGHKLADLAEVFPDPAQGLKTWKSQVDQAIQVISGLQQQWDEAVATYNKAIAAISSRRMTEDNFHPEIEEKKARATLEGAQRPLKKSYEDQLHQLNEAASQKADSIKAAADSKISPEAVKRGRNAVGSEFIGTDMPIVHAAASWAEAQADAPRMAADLEEAANSFGPLSEEDVKKLEERWGDKLRNPYYVQAMADAYRSAHRGAGDYSDMLNRLSIKTAGLSTNSESGAALRNSFIDRIGTAMVLSTGGIDASQDQLANSASYQQAKNALRGHSGVTIAQIEHANIESFKATGNKLYEFGPGAPHFRGYQVFSQATALAGIRNSNLAFGREVYEGGNNSLAAEMVRYDHDFQPSVPVKGPEEGYQSLIRWTREDGYARTQAMDPLQSLYVLSDTPDSMQAPDFASKYHELARVEQGRLGALRGFLMQDTSFDVENDWDRNGQKSSEKIPMTRYLTGNRNHGLFPPRGFVDGGDAFGSMIEDATRPLGDAEKSMLGDSWGDVSNQQARIVGNFTAGYQDGLDHDGGKIGSQDAFGATNSKLRSHAGVILGNWVESLAQMDTDDSGDTVKNAHDAVDEGSISETTGQARFVLSPMLRDALYGKEGLFADLAFDNPMQVSGQNTPNNPFDDTFEGGRPPALSTIQAAAYAGYKHDLTQAMTAEYRVDPAKTTESAEWSSAVNDGVKKWGGLLEHIESAVSDQEVAEHRAIADRNKLIRKGIDVIASTVPFSQVPGPKIVESLVSAVTNDGKNAVLDSILPTDFNREEFLKRLGREYAATQAVSDNLVSTYADLDEWPNSHGTPKQELVAEFLKKEEEGHHSEPVKADEHGGLPPYSEMTDAQRGRFRDFLKERTYLKAPLETAKNTTWAAFSKQEAYRH